MTAGYEPARGLAFDARPLLGHAGLTLCGIFGINGDAHFAEQHLAQEAKAELHQRRVVEQRLGRLGEREVLRDSVKNLEAPIRHEPFPLRGRAIQAHKTDDRVIAFSTTR